MVRNFFLLLITLILLTGCVRQVIDFSNVSVEIKNLNEAQEIFLGQKESLTTTIEVAQKPEVQFEVEKEKKEGEVEILSEEELPLDLDFSVPFAPQAPYAVWDDLHKEACEEAAMIITAKYFQNQGLNAHIMEQEILNLVKWEKENGYKIDLTAQEVAQIMKDYFGLKAEVIKEVTTERIKKELFGNKLIIVPAAGRKLGNPYFRQPGPIYHMLVIRGYDERKKEFITNDPGTKRGEGFRYKYQKLIPAIHNWDHEKAKEQMTEKEMEQGEKVMVVVGK